MDITRIVESRLRKELLALYFTNPEKGYYLRELERILGFSVGNIRRELLRLERAGLFERRVVGNLVYYDLNKSYPLFEEMKSIVFKTVGIVGSLREAFGRIRGIQFAIIYGSYATGTEGVASDIDVLIVGEPDTDELIEIVDKAEKRLQREINYTVCDRQDFEKKKKAKESFILDVIEKPKIFLVGDEERL